MALCSLQTKQITTSTEAATASRSRSMSSEMKMRPADDLEINLCHDDVMRQQLAQQAPQTRQRQLFIVCANRYIIKIDLNYNLQAEILCITSKTLCTHEISLDFYFISRTR